MTFVFATLQEDEHTELLDGIKDILKECYQITEDEALAVIHEGSEKAENRGSNHRVREVMIRVTWGVN